MALGILAVDPTGDEDRPATEKNIESPCNGRVRL